MKKILLFLWLPLSFYFIPLNVNAQNGWVNYNVPVPGGGAFHFADANTGIITGQYIYHITTNGGITWTSDSVPNPHSIQYYDAVYFTNGNTGWLGMSYEVVTFPIGFTGGCTYKTTNGGLTWGPCVNAGPVRELIFLNENTGYSATGGIAGIYPEGGIRKTTNGGTSWVGIYSGYYFTNITFINVNTGWGIGFFGDDIGSHINIMVRTTNGGGNWTTLIYDSTNISANDPLKRVQFTDQNTGYLLRNKLHKSTNGGANWFAVDTSAFSHGSAQSFFFVNNDTGWITGVFNNSKVYRTNNGGDSWTEQSIPQANVYGNIYFINELKGWALANNSSLLQTGTGGLTFISNISSEVPGTFSLHQNYPNPFNPSTSIRFDIQLKGFVSLKVFDISGREVGVLVDEELRPGVYEYSFDGSGLGSGVYFYKLQSGYLTETRRMVLLK